MIIPTFVCDPARRILRSPAVTDLQFRVRRALGRRRKRPSFGQTFSIGVYAGRRDPLSVPSTSDAPAQVFSAVDVTDMDAGFVADPFLIRWDGEHWMFFEVWNSLRNRGEIACAKSRDGNRWTYVGHALREPFHLSYPFVFEEQGTVFMVPETSNAGFVALYRAERFPRRWVRECVLLRQGYCDATLLKHDNLWWMFASPPEAPFEELHIHFAADLRGTWQPHPANPVKRQTRSGSRPGGRLLFQDSRLIRFAQVCEPVYGSAVRAFEVIELSPSTFREAAIAPDPFLWGSGEGWNAHGMHHIDCHEVASRKWIVAADGWAWTRPDQCNQRQASRR